MKTDIGYAEAMLDEAIRQSDHLRGIKNLLAVLTIVLLLLVVFGLIAVVS